MQANGVCTVPGKSASKGGALKSRTARSASLNYLAGLKLNKQLAAERNPTKTILLKPTKTSVTLKRLAANLSESHELSKKQAEAMLGDLVNLVTKHLKKGDRIRIGGLGILVVRKRAARMGRNPATGEPIQIKASKKVAFRAAKELKEAV